MGIKIKDLPIVTEIKDSDYIIDDAESTNKICYSKCYTRCLSRCHQCYGSDVLANKIIVSSTTDNITNYLYVNGEFVYSPLSVQVDPPT